MRKWRLTWRADLLSSSRRNSMDLARLGSSLRLCGESMRAESKRPTCWIISGCPDEEQPRLSMLLKRFESDGEWDASDADGWWTASGAPVNPPVAPPPPPARYNPPAAAAAAAAAAPAAAPAAAEAADDEPGGARGDGRADGDDG